MSAGQAPSRYTVARSVQSLVWGIGLIVLGVLVRELAGQRHLEILIEGGGGGDSSWSTVAWGGAAIAVVGLITALLGIGQLSNNIDYLAAREAERHRAEAQSAEQ